VTDKPNPNLQLANFGWSFGMNEAQQWEWVCRNPKGKVAKRCRRTFPTLKECVQDAATNGYAPNRTEC
jgi:hypothetical protein